MTTFEFNALRALAQKWRDACTGGFMPDAEGNRIAVTRTSSCAEELNEIIQVLSDLQRLTEGAQ